MISSFRHNGPGGDADEFVEIFNASTVSVTVSSLSTDAPPANGIGVFVSAGHGYNPQFGQTANVASLACQIPGSTVIAGRHWFLCVGTGYSLGARGVNSGTTHSVGDMVIGSGTATTNNIPDDAGMALLSLGSNIATQCPINPFGCPTGFNFGGNAIVYDKVGFDPYGEGSPSNTGPGVYSGNIYPSLAAQYCEGKCLSPVGDASVIPLGPASPCPITVAPSNPLYTTSGPSGQYDTAFPVVDGGFILRADGTFSTTHKCYGESGQYKIERRRSGQTFTASAGDIHRDSWNSITGTCTASPAPAVCGNADDFILDTPNPASANVGQTLSGISAVKSVLGSAAPHNLSAPPPIGQTQFTQDAFDTCVGAIIPCTPGQLRSRNAERRYAQDPNILGTNNDVFGTFIIRHRFVNSTPSVTGVRWRIDDISGLCGGQTGTAGTTSEVATQEARNLRLPNASVPGATMPVPSCQGEGSDTDAFTALLKAVNHYGEVVVDSSGTARIVWGTVLEDVFTAPAPQPATGALQPFGGGGNSSFVLNSTAVGSAMPYVVGAGPSVITNIGDGVSGGTGSFAVPTMSSSATNTIRVAFKFGVVKSGRFKLLLGREVE